MPWKSGVWTVPPARPTSATLPSRPPQGLAIRSRVDAGSGINLPGGTLTVTAGDNITLNGLVTANEVDLTSGGEISQTAGGAIAAASLNTSSATGTDLSESSTNAIGGLSASNTNSGNLAVYDNVPTLTLGTGHGYGWPV